MKKNTTTSTVCKYLRESRKMSDRALARVIKVASSTWHGYLHGHFSPGKAIKHRLVVFAGVASFDELVERAFLYYALKN